MTASGLASPAGNTAEAAAAAIIDRGLDADEIRDHILRATQRLIVLYGRSRSGKSDFVRNWLIPRLRAAAPELSLVYGKCDPELPTEFESVSGTIGLGDALAKPGIIVVDSFDTFLAQPRDERREATDRAFSRFEEGKQVKVVLVTDASQLANAYALTAYDPELVGAVFEIPPVTVAQGLSSLSHRSGVAEITYTKEALGVITSETRSLEKQGWEVTFEFIQFLDARIRHYAEEKKKQNIGRADLAALGGVLGMLREHYLSRVQDSPFDTEDEREVLQLVLESVIQARLDGRQWKADDVTARLGVDRERVDAVLEWLLDHGVLIRERSDDDTFECSPQQLAVVVLEAGEGRRLTVERVRRIVDEGVRSWEQLGSRLSLARFTEAHRARRFLLLDEASERFLLVCALRYDATDSAGPAAYWLRRINDRVDAMDILLSAIFDDDARVRSRAAELLREFPEPEVYERLSITALVDADPSVRQAAVSSLGNMKAPRQAEMNRVQERLLNEVKTAGSPYRDQAIDALRVFPSAEIAMELKKLVNDASSKADLRERAIHVLAALELPGGVDALVDIALHDPDDSDRSAASAALARTRSSELAERTLSHLGGFRRVSQSWLYIGTTFWFIVIVAGFVRSVMEESDVTLGLVFLLLVLTPIPTSWFLRRLRSGRIPRKSERGAMTAALFALCSATAIYVFHGLAHLLIGRWRRAVVLFAAEIVSLLLLNASVALTEGTLSLVYAAAGILLFVASYVYDVGAVLGQTLLLSSRNEEMQRKELVYRSVLRNPLMAGIVFDNLTSGNDKAAKGARQLLKEFGGEVQPEQLLDFVKTADPVRAKMAARALKGAKGDQTVRRLEELWKTGDERLRASIADILCGKPNQASLQALGRLRTQMPPWMRTRVTAARYNFNIGVWPLWGRLLTFAALPALVFFAYNGIQAQRNPAWSQLVMLRRSLHQGAFDGFLGFTPKAPSRGDKMDRLIWFLAENHPKESGNELLDHLLGLEDGKRLTHSVRASLAGGILVIAMMPTFDVGAELSDRVTKADSLAVDALFLGDTTTMVSTLDRIGRSAGRDNFEVNSAAVRVLTRLVLAKIPDPDSEYFAEQGIAYDDSVVMRQRTSEILANGEDWKATAVDMIGEFNYRLALPALDEILSQRSESPALARVLRETMEEVTTRTWASVKHSPGHTERWKDLLAVLDQLKSKPALTDEIRQFVASPADATVIEDPSSEDGFQHLFTGFEESGRYDEAVAFFQQLRLKYPSSVWPLKFLAMIHHENLAVSDPASFTESNRLMRELTDLGAFRAMRSEDSATYFRIVADYAEIALSAGDVETVERLARELGEPGRDPVYRYNSALFVYIARVMARDAVRAGVALTQLQQVADGLPVDFYNNWRYPGTRAWINGAGLPPAVVAAVGELCREGYWYTRAEIGGVMDRNRSALTWLTR